MPVLYDLQKMKSIAIRILECVLLIVSLGYFSTLGITAFFKLRNLLPVEWIVYRPLGLFEFFEVAMSCAVALSIFAVVLEWKRERRKVSYSVYLLYLSAPVVVSLILFLFTAWKIAQIYPVGLELTKGQVSVEITPVWLIVVGYMLFPIAHLALIRFKGRSSRGGQFRYGSASTPSIHLIVR